MSRVASCRAVALLGVAATPVEVEAQVADGLPHLAIVGLPDAALSEARDRVRAAVASTGATWPAARVTVALSPAALPKSGSGFDLAVAAVVLAASGQLPADALRPLVLHGELGLDGRTRPVPGALAAALGARRDGGRALVVPAADAPAARLVEGLEVLGVASLGALVRLLRGEPPLPGDAEPGPLADDGCHVDARTGGRAAPAGAGGGPVPDLADVLGQADARTAVEVAAAGGHHLLLSGPPGTGKTMLAERLPGLLPDLDHEAALEVAALADLDPAARALPGGGLPRRPPVQAPHCTASTASLVGTAGPRGVRPGALARAHRGVLLLDEAPEFQRDALEALRGPLDRGEVVLARAAATVRWPAAVQAVLTANPCPCARPTGCTCPPAARRRYAQRLSGPLLDRVDLRVEVAAPAPAAVEAGPPEATAVVAARVATARARARARLEGTPWRRNADVPGRVLRERFAVHPDLARRLDREVAQAALSRRGADRLLRVLWSVADLDGASRPGADQLAVVEALRRGVPEAVAA